MYLWPKLVGSKLARSASSVTAPRPKRIQAAPAPAAAKTATSPTAHTVVRRRRDGAPAVAGAARSGSSAKMRSRADWNRSAGSFCRQCWTIRCKPSGIPGGSGGGSSAAIARAISGAEAAANGRRPASIS
jgi:hypothetical protein